MIMPKSLIKAIFASFFATTACLLVLHFGKSALHFATTQRVPLSIITVVGAGDDEKHLPGFLRNMESQTAFSKSEILIASIGGKLSASAFEVIAQFCSSHENARHVVFNSDPGLYEASLEFVCCRSTFFIPFTLFVSCFTITCCCRCGLF